VCVCVYNIHIVYICLYVSTEHTHKNKHAHVHQALRTELKHAPGTKMETELGALRAQVCVCVCA
jgi:hypothetical protein